jgi:hypothetical protein
VALLVLLVLLRMTFITGELVQFKAVCNIFIKASVITRFFSPVSFINNKDKKKQENIYICLKE